MNVINYFCTRSPALTSSKALADIEKETDSLFTTFMQTEKVLSAKDCMPLEKKLSDLETKVSKLSLRKLSQKEESKLHLLGDRINVLYKALNTTKHIPLLASSSEEPIDPSVLQKKLQLLKKTLHSKNPSVSKLLDSLSSLERSSKKSPLSINEKMQLASELHLILKEVLQLASLKGSTTEVLPSFKEGLQNLGNTCYLNASYAFLQKSGLASCLALPKELSIFKSKTPSPEKLKDAMGKLDPSFKSSGQQDAMEALSLLLNQVSFAKNKKGFLEQIIDLILSIFSSETPVETAFSPLKTTYNWDVSKLPKHLQQEAKTTSHLSVDPIHTIGLPEKTKEMHVHDLLESYFTQSNPSSMDPNPVEDPVTHKTYLRAAKSIDRTFAEPPKHLVLSFNRFTNGRKLDNSILGLDEHLTLHGKHLETGLDMTYERSAAIIHTGSLNSGHYYAIVKGSDGKYYKFNDKRVSILSQKAADEEFKKAYLVYYKG